MGNCLVFEKKTLNPDEQLFKDMLHELRERRVRKSHIFINITELIFYY
jgi:hypothetical protein